MATRTSRDLTAYRRDILCELVADDPKRAELLLTLLIITGPETTTGAAARCDVEQQLISQTREARNLLTGFKQRVLEELDLSHSLVAAVTSLYILCQHF